MAKTKGQRVWERYEQMKQEKAPWLPLYQLIGEYIQTRKQNFTSDILPGSFTTEQLYDNTASNANHLMAASMIGALWPNGAKTFRIGPPTLYKPRESEEVKQWYKMATTRMVTVMDHPKSGLSTSLEEYMNDQGGFGISGIAAFENDDDAEVPVRYNAIDAKRTAVDENNHGFIDSVYIEKQMTIRQAVQEYEYENLPKAEREAWDKGRGHEKITILHAIEPRMDGDPYMFGAADMPYASIHIEAKSKKVVRESGYTEQPVFVSRFWKIIGEKQGRSPGMEALPDILEMNAIREAYTLAHEKNLDPPMAVYDDTVLGGGTIDTSAGAINVFSVSGRLGTGQKPVEQLITTGELESTINRIAELREIIRNHFFIDRLMDLNNETRMTLGEANIRNELRGQSLGTVYSRQIAELFVPLIERTFNILLRKGLFGVIPGSQEEMELLSKGVEPEYIPEEIIEMMMKGEDVYQITFISPAYRIMQAEELMGIRSTVEFIAGIAPLKPDVLDNFDFDVMARRVQEITGASEDTVVSMEVMQKIRKARQDAEAKAQELEAARSGSEATRNVAQAVSMVEGAA